MDDRIGKLAIPTDITYGPGSLKALLTVVYADHKVCLELATRKFRLTNQHTGSSPRWKQDPRPRLAPGHTGRVLRLETIRHRRAEA